MPEVLANDEIEIQKEKFEFKDRDLSKRTKEFSLRIINLYGSLGTDVTSQVIGKQVLRSGTSPGAHYHEAIHARSNAEFISKLEVALQELEETRYWLALLKEANIFNEAKLHPLDDEARQLIAIFITIVKKTKSKKRTKGG